MLCGVNMVLFRSDFLAQKLFVLALLLTLATVANAQSTDANTPSPVHSNTVTARIAARDLGDARLTDHYYAFTGTPGDLLITIQSNNLNGDVDIFTAGTLRPLGKVTLYAEISTPVTKGIYLRRREDLILRIEARSPNDDEGIYRVTFGGSFQPIVGGPDLAEAETPTDHDFHLEFSQKMCCPSSDKHGAPALVPVSRRGVHHEFQIHGGRYRSFMMAIGT